MSRSEILAAVRAGQIPLHRAYHLLCDVSYNRYPHHH